MNRFSKQKYEEIIYSLTSEWILKFIPFTMQNWKKIFFLAYKKFLSMLIQTQKNNVTEKENYEQYKPL